MLDIAQQDIAYQPTANDNSFSAAPTPPTIPESDGKPKGKANSFLFLALGITGLVVVFVVFLLVLNYFKIITLPTIYPNQLGFLPHLSKSTTSIIKTSNNTPSPTIEYNTLASTPMGNCPLSGGCKTAVQIGETQGSSSQNFSGLGFNLTSSQSAILAVIDGTINIQNATENGTKLTVVTITNSQRNIKINYKFPQDSYLPVVASGAIQQNQKIGDLINNASVTYQSRTFSFILNMQVISSNEYIILKPSANGLTIDSPNK